jgi:hypothetical protein
VSRHETERSSERETLARIALVASLSLPDVVDTDVGPNGAWVTEVEGERLPGVVAAAEADGRYSLELHLVARPVPLGELAERVRERIVRRAEQAGMSDAIGSIDVSIEDVLLEEDR